MSKETQENKKPQIMVFADYYLPGYKSGGGMRTIVNMVDRLQDRYDFWIVTRDHDGKLDRKQYTTVKINQWNDIGGAKVYYLSKDNIRIAKLRKLIKEVIPDSIYLNSYFATLAIYVLKLRKLNLIPNLNIVLAPCGELSDGALKLKHAKKKVFINVAKLANLFKNVIWKASTELEKNEIGRLKPKNAKFFIAPDMPPKYIFKDYKQELKPRKKVGEVKMVFLSRFMRKKNFKWLIENLSNIEGKLSIDIYGPIEDSDYWNECLDIIKNLPNNISIESKGSIPYEKVLEVLVKYHFFIMPTLGENFGHIFIEAMACGCPLLISDRTPWRGLKNKNIGWDLTLENSNVWNDVINECIQMNDLEYKAKSENSRAFLVHWLSNKKIQKDTVKVLDYSLSNTLSVEKDG